VKIVTISDTHSLHQDVSVPEGDVLIHAGDLSREGTLEEVKQFNDWLKGLTHEYKILVPGNHDFCFEDPRRRDRARDLLTEAQCLIDDDLTIEGVRFWGAPWQPKFFDWAFNRERGRSLRKKWSLVPEDVDVLVTHGPPRGIGDRVAQGDRVGCFELRKRVFEVQPDYHVFGHIHEGYGRYAQQGVEFLNASVCDVYREPRNAPLVFTL
jgi:Icc-related predicted phosphoesterase